MSRDKEMALNQKGTVAKCDHREYGFAQIQISKINENASVDALFEGLGDDMQVRSLYVDPLYIYIWCNVGLDVAWRPTLRDPTQFPLHRRYEDSALRSHRTRFETLLWNPVPSRGHAYSPRQTSHRALCGQYMRVSDELDDGMYQTSPVVHVICRRLI
jgi:hypothetical protein